MSSLKQLAIKGTIWTVGSYGTSQILRLGSNLVLTRLLLPELFGLMTLTNVFIMGLHLFSDIGLNTSIVQNKRGDDPDFLNTAWTLQIVRSIGLWLCCILLALPVAELYKEPRFLWLLPIVGLNTVITGFSSTAYFTLSRHVAVSQLAVFDLANQVVSLAVTIIWAWFNPTIWALVAGGLISSIMQVIWSHRLLSNFSNRFTWDQDSVKAIFSFGKWIFLSTAITFFAEQTDRLIIGKLFSLEMLGIYGIAFTFADIPRSITMTLASKVIFPIVSKLNDSPREAIRSKILRNRLPILAVLAIALTILVGFGDVLISKLYSKDYIFASWMLPILSLGIWPRVLCNTIEPSLLAIGKPQYTAAANFSRLLWNAIGILVGFLLMGILGVVIAVALNDLFYYGIISYGLLREEMSVIWQDLFATGFLIVLISLVLLCRFSWGYGSPIDSLL